MFTNRQKKNGEGREDESCERMTKGHTGIQQFYFHLTAAERCVTKPESQIEIIMFV